MNIILDTNIFRNDFFFKSQSFGVLKDYLKKTDSQFILPQIIFEEVQGVYKRTLTENLEGINKARTSVNNILNESRVNDFNIDVNEETKNYIEFLLNELTIKQNQIISYKDNYLGEIVKRAINTEKPFRNGDEGFRDAIIWLTLLDHCKSSHEKQIIFISNNPKDFGDILDPTQLNSSLQAECERLGIKINYFRTPKDFVERHSKNIEHITFDWLGEILDENWLSDVICDDLNNYRDKRVISWYENKYTRESTDSYRCIRSHSYSYDDLFIYEMVDGTYIVNFTVSTEIETEFEFYDYDRYGFEEYRISNHETLYINTEIYVALTISENEILKIEISDIGF